MTWAGREKIVGICGRCPKGEVGWLERMRTNCTELWEGSQRVWSCFHKPQPSSFFYASFQEDLVGQQYAGQTSERDQPRELFCYFLLLIFLFHSWLWSVTWFCQLVVTFILQKFSSLSREVVFVGKIYLGLVIRILGNWKVICFLSNIHSLPSEVASGDLEEHK